MQFREQYLVRATAFDGAVRAFALETTEVVAELQRRHGTWPAATAALGRTATGALLLGAQLKEADHLVTIRIQGGGPGGTILASANGAGDVRGLIGNPRPEIDEVRDGKLNVSGVVGCSGQLTVTRDLGLRHPYVGTVELVSGEVGEDLAHYLARSEQVPSAVGIGVFVEAGGDVGAAGGYLVQLLPGANGIAEQVETTIRALPHPTTMLRQGDTPERMLDRIFGSGQYDVLARTPVRFSCPCSRDRAERALLLLGEGPLGEMLEQARVTGYTELSCEFCRENYRFSPGELEALRERRRTGN